MGYVIFLGVNVNKKQDTVAVPEQLHLDDLVQDCSNSIANTLELLQSCTKPSI